MKKKSHIYQKKFPVIVEEVLISWEVRFSLRVNLMVKVKVFPSKTNSIKTLTIWIRNRTPLINLTNCLSPKTRVRRRGIIVKSKFKMLQQSFYTEIISRKYTKV